MAGPRRQVQPRLADHNGWQRQPPSSPPARGGHRAKNFEERLRKGVLKESIEHVAIEAELKAMIALDAAMQCTTISQVVASLHLVQRRLSSPTRSPRGAAEALATTADAVKDCCIPRVRVKLADAERALRDVVVCRAQKSVPFSTNKVFKAKLEELFAPGSYDFALHSMLLNSHKYIFSGILRAFRSKGTEGKKGPQPDKAPPGSLPPAPTDASSETAGAAPHCAGQDPAEGHHTAHYAVRAWGLPPDVPESSEDEDTPCPCVIDRRAWYCSRPGPPDPWPELKPGRTPTFLDPSKC